LPGTIADCDNYHTIKACIYIKLEVSYKSKHNKGVTRMRISEEQTEQWLGKSASVDDYIELVTEIANGEYSAARLKQAIVEACENNKITGRA
jgi:hypothetical protein